MTPAMKIVSVNLSAGRGVPWNNGTVETGIFKDPVPGPVRVHKLGLEGDHVADLAVHGGEYKAVYAYSAEHYPWWEAKLHAKLAPGAFGENLTVAGLDEPGVCLGDHFRAGTCVLEAAEPRLPCFKLGLKFGDQGIVGQFLDSGRWGIYFRVVEEGEVKAGDAVERVFSRPERVPIHELARLRKGKHPPKDLLELALKVPTLNPKFRAEFEERLKAL